MRDIDSTQLMLQFNFVCDPSSRTLPARLFFVPGPIVNVPEKAGVLKMLPCGPGMGVQPPA